jgi:hypothetical protein
LRTSLRSASWSPAFVFLHKNVLAAMHEASPGLDTTSAPTWINIIEDLQDRSTTEQH